MADPSPTPDSSHSRWFTEEVQPHDGALKSYLRGSFPSVRDIDDVVQESYLRLWKFRLSGPIRASKSLLFLIARHLAIDAVRHARIAPVATEDSCGPDSLLAEQPDPGAALSHKEKIDLLAEALAALPSRCREVVYLRRFCGLPQKEVAERLGISVRTVESQYACGMKRCESFLRKHGVESFSSHES